MTTPIQIAILDGFGVVIDLDILSACQIRYRAGNLPNAIKGPGRKAELVDGPLPRPAGAVVDFSFGLYLYLFHLLPLGHKKCGYHRPFGQSGGFDILAIAVGPTPQGPASLLKRFKQSNGFLRTTPRSLPLEAIFWV